MCVDFDDTLVTSQEHFERALGALGRLMRAALGTGEEHARRTFDRLDAAHHHLGRHRNRFLLSVFATYCELAGVDHVPEALVPELARIAAEPYDALPEPRPGAEDALRRLQTARLGPVWLVTAGDPVVQLGRVHRSGLAPYFERVCVVPDKTPRLFAELGRGHARRVMIGNSPRTDLLPALEAGFEAIHVRTPTWWLDDGPVPAGLPTCASFAAAVDRLLAGPR